MAEAIYVRDFFEDKFIEKFLTYSYSKDLAIKKYNIDIGQIEKDTHKQINKLLGKNLLDDVPFSGDFNEDQERENAYFQEITQLKETYNKYTFIHDSKYRYTFELFLVQLFSKSSDINKYFLEDNDFFNEDFDLDNFFVDLNTLIDDENYLFSDICNAKLPFIIDEEEKEKFNLKYNNKNSTFLKAYQIIMEEIFNYNIKELYEDFNYKSYIKLHEPEELNNIQIEVILEIIRERFLNFRESFFDYFKIYMQFAFAESLIFSSKSKFYYKKYNLLDKDKQKTDFNNNVLEKLLISKKNMYKKFTNLPNDRRIGNTSHKINKVAEIKSQHDDSKILKYFELVNTYIKTYKFKVFKKEQEYKLLKVYYDKHKTTELRNHKDIEAYFYQHSPKEIAIAMFIIENDYDISAKTLAPSVKGIE